MSDFWASVVGFSGACIIGLFMLVFGVWMLGSMFEGVGVYYEQHERCLRHATNGIEIEKCR